MFCEKCFALLPDNARFCRECGKKTAFPKPEATVTKERALFTPEEKIRSADEAETEETSEAVKTVPEVLHEKRSVFSAVLIIFAFLASLGALALMVLPFTDIKYGFPHYVRTLDLAIQGGDFEFASGFTVSVVIAFGGVITDMILVAKSISGKKQYVSLFGSVIIILLLGYCLSIASVGASPSNESGFFGGAVSGIGYFRINRFFPLSAAFCMISAILQWLSRVLGKHGENNFENI